MTPKQLKTGLRLIPQMQRKPRSLINKFGPHGARRAGQLVIGALQATKAVSLQKLADAIQMLSQQPTPAARTALMASFPPEVQVAVTAAALTTLATGQAPSLPPPTAFGDRPRAATSAPLPSGGYGPPSPFPGAMPVMPSGGGYGYGPSPSGNYGGGGGYFDPGDPGNIDWGDNG
jgi:hypothetical protein